MDKGSYISSSDLKAISPRDLLAFGLHEVAYVRMVQIGGRSAYAIHAADGTPLSVMETMDTALAAIRHNDLEPIRIN